MSLQMKFQLRGILIRGLYMCSKSTMLVVCGLRTQKGRNDIESKMRWMRRIMRMILGTVQLMMVCLNIGCDVTMMMKHNHQVEENEKNIKDKEI